MHGAAAAMPALPPAASLSLRSVPRRTAVDEEVLMDFTRIDAYIDEHFPRHLARVQAFVRQPSISGEGVGMAEMGELVGGSIRDLGGSAEIVATPGWPVVFGQVDAGAPRTLLLYGMYDVQPVAGEEWLVPPARARRRPVPRAGGGG